MDQFTISRRLRGIFQKLSCPIIVIPWRLFRQVERYLPSCTVCSFRSRGCRTPAAELSRQTFLAATSSDDRLITQPTEIFNHHDTCFSFFFSDRASAAAIIIYYAVKYIVEQRNGTTRNKKAWIARHMRVDHDGRGRGKRGEGYLTRSVIDCVYHAKPLPTPRRSPRINV